MVHSRKPLKLCHGNQRPGPNSPEDDGVLGETAAPIDADEIEGTSSGCYSHMGTNVIFNTGL